MDINLFKTFIMVAKLGNITQAAENLNFTQPAVTSQIKLLEKNLGVNLFERIGKKNFLTAAGKVLVEHSENILNDYALMKKEVQTASLSERCIRIGVSTFCASYLVTSALNQYDHRENIILEICSNTDIALDGLLKNKFDFIICHTRFKNNKVSKIDLLNDKMVWVINKKMFNTYKQNLDIFSYPFITFKTTCAYRLKYEKLIKKPLKTIMECSDSDAVKNAVLNGLGLGFLPHLLVKDYLHSKDLIEIPFEPSAYITLSLSFYKKKIFSKEERLFLKILSSKNQRFVFTK